MVEWLLVRRVELSSVVLSESEVAAGPTTTQLYTETLVTFLEKYFLKFNLSKVFFNVSLIGE